MKMPHRSLAHGSVTAPSGRGSGRAGVPRARRVRSGPGFGTYASLGFLLLLSVFPLYWSLVVASRDQSSISRYPPVITPGPRLWEHIRTAFEQANFGLALLNSAIVCTVITFCVLLTSTLAGFAFARLRFRGRNALLGFVVGTMLIPTQLGVIPLYIMVTRWFGWSNDLRAVMVPSLVSAFGVFFMRQYLASALPVELLEAGRMDGASTLRLYWSIVLPVARPAAAVLGLLTFIMTWNDLFWPLIVLNSQNPTVQVAISSLAAGVTVDYSLTLTGAVIGTFPILIVFLLLGRQIVGGIMQGAVKG
jgi:cellobiose transport system permease protein